MIAKYLNVNCSRHCELLLAFTYLVAPERLLPIANRIEGRTGRAAVKLASAIARLDPKRAQSLAQNTAALVTIVGSFMEV